MYSLVLYTCRTYTLYSSISSRLAYIYESSPLPPHFVYNKLAF
uniref:Uncharacterized protein n=1 Tax=Setaria italica TaxID=4555 RepID=K4AI17_SETIT